MSNEERFAWRPADVKVTKKSNPAAAKLFTLLTSANKKDKPKKPVKIPRR